MCIFFEICEKRPFRKVWVGGSRGGRAHFSAKGYTLDGAHEQCTAPLNHVYSESSSPSALPFSGRAGTPLGQTSPCLSTGIHFFNFPQSCNLRAFTGTHPPFIKRHSPQAIGCEVHIVLFDRLHNVPGNGLTVFSHT